MFDGLIQRCQVALLNGFGLGVLLPHLTTDMFCNTSRGCHGGDLFPGSNPM